jgi:hypothetical protein
VFEDDMVEEPDAKGFPAAFNCLVMAMSSLVGTNPLKFVFLATLYYCHEDTKARRENRKDALCGKYFSGTVNLSLFSNENTFSDTAPRTKDELNRLFVLLIWLSRLN